MNEYVNVKRFEGEIFVTFYIEYDEVMEIGKKLEEINENAYMNGENWSILLDFYLKKNELELLKDLDTDPEAGMYSAFYPYSEENERKANRLAKLICDLIETPEVLYKFVEDYGDNIEWD